MLTYVLFVALTNLVIGIVLGYFYGPVFTASKADLDSSGRADHAPVQMAAAFPALKTEAATAVATEALPSAAPAANSKAAHGAVAVPAPVDDPRPVKQTASREVTALDLADVMSELGLEPEAAAPVAS